MYFWFKCWKSWEIGEWLTVFSSIFRLFFHYLVRYINIYVLLKLFWIYLQLRNSMTILLSLSLDTCLMNKGALIGGEGCYNPPWNLSHLFVWLHWIGTDQPITISLAKLQQWLSRLSTSLQNSWMYRQLYIWEIGIFYWKLIVVNLGGDRTLRSAREGNCS
jgi:hypothetical protein